MEKQLKLFSQSEEESNSDNNTLNKENNNFKTEKIKTKNEYKKYDILKMQEEIYLKWFHIFKEKNKDYFDLYTFNF